MKALELKLAQIKAENDKLESEINALLGLNPKINLAIKTKTVYVNNISAKQYDKLISLGFDVILVKE